MAPVPQITALDFLALLPTAGYALSSMLYTILTRPFSSHVKPDDLFRDAVFSGMRAFLGNINTAQEQWSQGTTEAEYNAAAKRLHFSPDTELLSSGLKVHWLGARDAKHTILYFHGGGFNLAASNGHFDWLLALKDDLATQAEISILVVSYTLAPEAQYPTQLKQAAESLQWLISERNKRPENIIVGGDSAGGNLSVALLSHLLHPHPDVPKLTLQEPLAAALLISPWAKFVPEDDSITRNQRADLVTTAAAKRWSSNYLGSNKLDNYNQPADADDLWFAGLDKQVKDILVYGASAEMLIDSITVFAKKLQQAHPRVDLVVTPGAAHIDIIIDKMLGYKHKAEGTKVMESWIAQKLQN